MNPPPSSYLQIINAPGADMQVYGATIQHGNETPISVNILNVSDQPINSQRGMHCLCCSP